MSTSCDRVIIVGAVLAWSIAVAELMADDSLLKLTGKRAVVTIHQDLMLSADHGPGIATWQTSGTAKPTITVRTNNSDHKVLSLELASAGRRGVTPFEDSEYSGSAITLAAYPQTDVELELIFALARREDELLIQVRQTGGDDTVTSIKRLYHFTTRLATGGYMVTPRGCGYLFDAAHRQNFTDREMVGLRYAMPIFGLVQGKSGLMAIVDTYWDAEAFIEHLPDNDQTGFGFDWQPSLDELRYPRRLLVRFVDGGYVEMAKAYRQRLQEQEMIRTLKDRAAKNVRLKRYLEGVEYRWHSWTNGQEAAVLRDIGELQKRGIKVNLFFPKWQGEGYPLDFGNPPPVAPGGWDDVAKFAREVHDMGCPIKVFFAPRGTPYDKVADLVKQNIDLLARRGMPVDMIYFDGYSAQVKFPQDASGGEYTRKQCFEFNVGCFRAVDQHGLLAGAELPRFWSIPYCDFFCIVNWSSDYSPVGEPIPWTQLVFHDCFSTCFMGGGYGHLDWPEDRNPRLYELLLTTMPSYKWAGGEVPTKDWNSPNVERFCDWLRLWAAYHTKTKYSEMVSHEFLDPQRTLHRIRFADDIAAEFDMKRGMVRVQGVQGFTGDWQRPYQP